MEIKKYNPILKKMTVHFPEIQLEGAEHTHAHAHEGEYDGGNDKPANRFIIVGDLNSGSVSRVAHCWSVGLGEIGVGSSSGMSACCSTPRVRGLFSSAMKQTIKIAARQTLIRMVRARTFIKCS